MNPRLSWLILALVAVALRLPDIGNPLVDIDEQMYLLVGQRMWDGAIPYVDIWDRKPIGLFLIYAAGGAIPGDPVVVCHLLALAAAIATAGVIASLARRFAPPQGALVAGIVYLAWLELVGGRGGQSPVFYDLAIAGAAWWTWQAIEGRRHAGMAAMLLAGVALQIKPTAVFEGGFLGLTLLVASWRRHRRVGLVAVRAIGWIGMALLPTIAAAAGYAAIGHADAWWFANVESIFLRRLTPDDPIFARLAGVGIVLLVPAALAIRGIAAQPRDVRLFLGGWLASATIGWLLVPPYFNHYALPLLVPVTVAAALTLDRRGAQILVGLAGGGLLLLSGYPHWGDTADTRRRVAALAAVIDAGRGRNCLFVFQAQPTLYSATRSCLPTRFPFPFHLVERSEAQAIGVDPTLEVARILATRPRVIAAGDIVRNRDRPTVRLVRRTLADHYRAVASDVGTTIYKRVN